MRRNLFLSAFVLLSVVSLTLAATTISFTTSNVIRSNVKRLGLNLGGRSTGDHMMKNMLDNPGFEGQEKAINALADASSTTTLFVQGNLWTQSNTGTAQPTGFWNNANYHVVTGSNQGAQGTVTSFGYDSSGHPIFQLSPALSTAPAALDVMSVYKKFPGTIPSFIQDARPGSDGVQSKNISSIWTTYYDGGYRDTDPTIGRSILISGNWTLTFWAKAPTAPTNVSFYFGRESWTGANGSPFVTPTFSISQSDTWQQFSYNFSVSPTLDVQISPLPSTTCSPWPGCSRPLLQISFTPVGGSGWFLMDDVNLYQRDDTNPTVFTDRVVKLMNDYRPGVLRYWGGQLGASLDQEIATVGARGTHGYAPNGGMETFDYSLHEFFQLCQLVGADPWYVVPPTWFPSEYTNLVQFLAGPSTSGYGAKRAALGQSQPWTSVFGSIYLEYGNEIWGGGQPGDPFAGASMGSTNEGKADKYVFGIIRGATYFDGSKIKLIAGGQYGYPGANQNIEAGAGSQNDLLALAPYYYGTINNYNALTDRYLPLYTSFVEDSLSSSGTFNQSYQYVKAASNTTGMAIYEINFGTTGVGVPPMTIRNTIMTSLAGGLSLSWSMLNYLKYYNAQPSCAFSFLGYSFQYEFDPPYSFPCNYNVSCFFAKVWGTMRDLSGVGTKRPTWLSVEAVNTIGMLDNMITTTQAGDNPTWTQNAINGLGATQTMTYINSFGFKSNNGQELSLVLYNFHLTSTLTASISLPAGSPAWANNASAVQLGVSGSNAEDTNEAGPTVVNSYYTLTDAGGWTSAYTIQLPPHSLTVIQWVSTTFSTSPSSSAQLSPSGSVQSSSSSAPVQSSNSQSSDGDGGGDGGTDGAAVGLASWITNLSIY